MLPNRQIKTAAALALALATIGPAAASARQIDGKPLHTTTTRSQTSAIVRVTAPQNGFDWATPASAPPAASRSRCSASAVRW